MLRSIKVLSWSLEKTDSGAANASKTLPRLAQKKVKVRTIIYYGNIFNLNLIHFIYPDRMVLTQMDMYQSHLILAI